MQNIQPASSPSSNVSALFADRAFSFVLPNGATLGDLAARLARLGAGTPLTVTVKLD
jgi:hypothetical protein